MEVPNVQIKKMGQVIAKTTFSICGKLVVQMVKWLVNHLYMPDDMRDQKHKELCVKCILLMMVIGISVIMICWQ